MANPSLQIGSGNWAIKADELLGYRVVGNKYFPVPIDVSRATAATRVDEAGLVDYAEILGGEEVTNGDFTGVTELVADGDFSLTGTQAESTTGTYWTTGSKWVINSNSAYTDATAYSNLSTYSVFEEGKTYTITVEVSGGNCRVYFGTSATTHHLLTDGLNTITAVAEGTTLTFRPYTTPTTISNVSVKEAGEDWTFDAGWSFGNNRAIVSPTGSTIYLSQNFTTVNGQYYKIEYEILSSSLVGATYFALSSSSAFGFFNISTAVGTHTYYREVIDDTATDAFKVFSSSNSGSLEITNISVEESTRDNIARIDYTDGSSPHLLSEPQRTNLLTQSNQFDTTWVQSGTLTSGQDGVGGSTDAWKFQNPNSTSSLYQPDTTSGVQTLSAYFKKNSNYGVRFYAFGSVNCSAFFDLNNGAVVVEFNSTAKIETVGDDWFRCSMTFDQTNTRCDFYVTNNASTQVLGDYTIQYAQLEAGSYATSYIPTSGSTVTRNQDEFTRDGLSSLINSTEGVLFAEIAAFADYSTYRYMGLTDGSSDNRVIILYYNSSTRIRVLLSSGGTKYFDANYAVTSIEDFHKVALKWKENDFALWIDGVERAIDTSGLAPIGLNTVALDQAGGDNFYGKVKQLQVYPTALSDSELTILTTP